MKIESLLCLTVFIMALIIVAMIYVLSGGPTSPCFQLHGIDHNGNDDPFTLFIGGC